MSGDCLTILMDFGWVLPIWNTRMSLVVEMR